MDDITRTARCLHLIFKSKAETPWGRLSPETQQHWRLVAEKALRAVELHPEQRERNG